MSIRVRKFVGTVLMIVLVIGWALLFMALAQGRIAEAGRFWHFVYYVVAGLGWTIPAAFLIRWMQRPAA
ncbi:DUF2842 domain-containing protein [Terrihabitans sp. B22-R8]|uniref:DUF2842 domain-containing protein n=1 Tax=Terrihabitans sp. B22-R8 TaxID=3425128 RepID=UPI00403C018F